MAAARARGLFASARQANYLGVLARIDGLASAQSRPANTRSNRDSSRANCWRSGCPARPCCKSLQLIEGWRFADAVKLVRAAPTLSHTLPAEISMPPR